MPWQVTDVLDQRRQFVKEWFGQECSRAELCRRYGISRKTGYELMDRFQQQGLLGLQDRSRAPRSNSRAVTQERQECIIAARLEHPTWGARKLYAWLKQQCLDINWPCPSTIGDLLHREGLTVARRRCRRTPPYTQPFAGCEAPNAVWCADFKGWFRTGDGQPCYPFTLSDAYSRFLLRCQALPRADYTAVQPLFDAAFREFGLPVAIRTDNGPPFAARGLGALSRLSVWWVKLGILPERIAPGHPEQNGRHERMHGTLKRDAATPPRATRRAQQHGFDRFRHVYNCERPHEALDQHTPASCYQPSTRRYPCGRPGVTYPDDAELRRVRHNGEIRWRCQLLYVSELLAGELVGLQPIDDRYWRLSFGPLELAVVDNHCHRLIVPKSPPRRGG